MSDLLQVYFQNQLVGHFNVDARGYAGREEIYVLEKEEFDLSRSYPEIRVPLKVRRFSVDDFELERLDAASQAEHFLASKNVPRTHIRERNHSSFSTTFYWTAAVLPDLALYQEVFDLDLFIPEAIGEPDKERISGITLDKVWLDVIRPSKAPLGDSIPLSRVAETLKQPSSHREVYYSTIDSDVIHRTRY